MEIITWIVFGLIVGFIAKLLYPGRQSLGFVGTMVLGIVGSLVGGFLSWAMGLAPEGEGPLRGSGWIMSIIGALVVVWITLYLSNRRKPKVAGTGTQIPG